MSCKARTIAPALWPLFAPAAHANRLRDRRHVGIGRYAHTYENTAIVATALDKNRRLCFLGQRCRRLIPAARREAHLKSRYASIACGLIRFVTRIGIALDKLVVGFCAQAVGEEHNHAPHQLGALLNGGSTLVAEHSLDANFALHVVKTLNKPDGYDRRSMVPEHQCASRLARLNQSQARLFFTNIQGESRVTATKRIFSP